MSELKTTVKQDPEPKRRRHFTLDSANDLLFWALQLALVGISLAIMWIKVDGTTKAMKRVIAAQEKQLDLARKEALTEEANAQEARNAEHQRSIQFMAAAGSLNTMLSQVSEIQADIQKTLSAVTEINQRVLAQSEVTKNAALEAQSAAKNAAGAASGAAGAASRAAANASRTGVVVASKVVTASDKRQVEAQQRALAAKQQQLTRTIKEVKKNGPNLIQQIFH